MAKALNDVMEFDHVVQVHPNGSVTDAPDGLCAPESLISTDADGQILADDETAWRDSLKRQGWSVYTDGYSGQDRYRGPIMHPSEYIGGRLERDILSEPGYYVAITVETLGDDEEPAGWAVAFREV